MYVTLVCYFVLFKFNLMVNSDDYCLRFSILLLYYLHRVIFFRSTQVLLLEYIQQKSINANKIIVIQLNGSCLGMKLHDPLGKLTVDECILLLLFCGTTTICFHVTKYIVIANWINVTIMCTCDPISQIQICFSFPN
jgi:hypothetical protein